MRIRKSRHSLMASFMAFLAGLLFGGPAVLAAPPQGVLKEAIDSVK
jgi:hypothetical protein